MSIAVFPMQRGPNGDGVGFVGGWRITSYFGGRIDPLRGVPSYHGGQDIAVPRGTPYFAVVDGYVSQFWDNSGGGNWTMLTGADGARYGYGHALRFEPGVNGRHVRAGDVIAYADSTGASTGDHLHFAFDPPWIPGTAYGDPFDILMEAANAGRYPGGSFVPPLPTIGEPADMTPDEHAMLAKVLERVSPFGLQADILDTLAVWENDTRLVVLNGFKAIIGNDFSSDRLTQIGWASRDYPFCYEGQPEVFMWVDTTNGRCRQWIPSEKQLRKLTQTKLNPAIQVFDPADEAQDDIDYPLVGRKPS